MNKEDDMRNEIKILQFLSEKENGSCTQEEFNNECDTDPAIHLAVTLLKDLIPTDKVMNNEVTQEKTITQEGRNYLAELLSLSEE